MSDLDTGDQKPKTGADNTADQMNQGTDLTPEQINAIGDESARKLVQSLQAQKLHWREKALKADEALKAKADAPADQDDDKPAKKAKKTDYDPDELIRRAKTEILLQNKYPDLDDNDLKLAKTHAEAQGKTLTDVVDSEFFQAYLNDKRAQVAAANASADPSNRTGNATPDWSKYERDPSLVHGLDKENRKKFTSWLEAKRRK